MTSAGPSTRAVMRSNDAELVEGKVKIIDVTGSVAREVLNNSRVPTFSEVFGDSVPAGALVGRGDALDISIWEAPPAALFSNVGSYGPSAATDAGVTVARNTTFPEQVVGSDGTISVPFAGSIPAAGRTPQKIADEIRGRLIGKAHDPQVIVRLAHNATSNVTVVGEVTNSVRMPLTAKGERLLDALASAGGVRQPVGKMTIQLTRGETFDGMSLETVIRDPRQNIMLQAGDVITLLYQPYSFTTLGAAGKNEEVNFEATGLTLSQALGRMGGLNDQRASARGVFIFRFEDPAVLGAEGKTIAKTENGKVPVIYRVDLKDPKTLFVAQSFPIKDKDVIYVSNAPLADFSKFLQAVSQIIYPIATIQNANVF